MEPGTLVPAESAAPGVGIRLLSTVYEAMLAFAVAFLAGLAFHGAAEGRLAGGTRLLFQVYLFVVLGIYFVWCWTRGRRTLPMQTWKMRIVRRDGAPVEVARAVLRYGLAWISTIALGTGFFWAWFDRDRQFLHDRLAGTRIVSSIKRGAG